MANISTKLHFPARLYQLIEIEDPAIIAWEIDGRSFRIVDSKRFRTETVPKYFRHGNMASIQRQLNLYGFRCTNRIDEKGVFCHPSFVRGQYDEVRNIRRKKTWPTKRKPKVDATATTTANAVATSATSPSSSSSSSSCCGYSLADPSCAGYDASNNMFELGCNNISCPTTMAGYDSPLTRLLTSDEFLMDLFDDGKTLDENILLNAFEAGDFDQNLFSVFADDTFAEMIN